MRTGKVLILMLISVIACQNKVTEKKKVEPKGDGFGNDSMVYKEFPESFVDSLETFFEPDFSGTVLVYKNGMLYRKAFGYTDRKGQDSMRVDDIFQLASVSKTVTATAVMILDQEGKISIDSPVVRYLNDFPYPKVKVRQLLNHRSGLANYIYYTDTFWKDTSKHMDNDQFYSFMCQCKPVPYLDPEVSFSYCNTNYAFLAVLIEKISGKKFHQFVEERIFKPAGMRSSFYKNHRPGRIKNRVLTGRFDQYEYTGTYYLDGVLGDKSLYSNVDDLFRFHKALEEGKLISRARLEQMSTASYDHNVFGGSYGLGFRLKQTPYGQWVYHNGWWRGFWTAFWNRFDKDICFVVLTNNKHSSHVPKPAIADFLMGGGLPR